MTTESTSIATPSTLLEELIERTRLSPFQLTVAVGLVLVLSLVGVASLAGVPPDPSNANFWRGNLVWPAVIAYSLLITPVSRWLRNGAIQAFRPLVPLADDDFQCMLAEASIFSRRREWLAVGIGAGSIMLLVVMATDWASMEPSNWLLTIYGLLAGGLTCGLIGLAIYSSMAGTKLFTELSRYPLNVSVFDLTSLEPIARWSLGTTLTYIGGITLSLLFLPRESFQATGLIIMIYLPLTLTAVLVFFLNMNTVHGDMVEAKSRELNVVRDNLLALSRALKERTARGEIENPQDLLDAIRAWRVHEEWIRGLPEWPYTASIKRNLILSLLLPGAVGIIREALSGFLRQLLPLP
jgi:hypothetical protein